MWRVGLSERRTATLGCVAVVNAERPFCLIQRSRWFQGRFATQRGQAPSPQGWRRNFVVRGARIDAPCWCNQLPVSIASAGASERWLAVNWK